MQESTKFTNNFLKELSKYFSVTSIAPSSEQSWIAKSISRAGNLWLTQLKLNEFEIYSLNGTPSDCVQIGLHNVLHEKPKLVVSGINTGLNTGHARILSSGTIGASMEASIDQVQSISASMHIPENIKISDINEIVFQNAAKIVVQIIILLTDECFGKNIDLISINIPFNAKPDTEIVVTKPHKNSYEKLFHKSNGKYNHKTPSIDFSSLEHGTDIWAIANNKISVTPISLNLFSEKWIKKMNKILNSKKWKL